MSGDADRPIQGAAGHDSLTLERLDDLQSARDSWARLGALGGNLFTSWEWTEAWWRCFGAGRKLLVTLCRQADGEVIGILPLYVSATRPLRVIRFLGHGPSDQLGPLCAPADRPRVARALGLLVERELERPGLFLAERLWGDEGWPTLLGTTPIKREASPVLAVRGRSFDGFLGSRSANFREQVRGRLRRLARGDGFQIRLTEDRARLDEDFSTLIDLHQAGRPDSVTFAGQAGEFHRLFAARALDQGWLRLWLLELEGRPVAAWYGLRYGGNEVYYQAGRDPAFDRRSVGFVLLCHSIRAAFDDGVDEYRFGLGPEPYKRRFAEQDPGLDSVAVGTGIRGRLAVRAAREASRVPPALRSSVRQRLGG